MTALIAILLLLFTPAVMLFIRTLWPNSRFLWLAALFGTLLAWVAVFIARYDLPFEIAPQTWQPAAFFPLSPALLVDTTAWIFALTLATHAVAIMLTGTARLGGWGVHEPIVPIAGENEAPSPVSKPSAENQEDAPALQVAGENEPLSPAASQPPPLPANWKAWAANLALTSLGLVAVLAGNLLTLLLAWSALDILELLILLGQVSSSEQRGQVVRTYGARCGGTIMLLLAGLFIWAGGGELDFNQSAASVNLLLFIAASLRLGILPLQVPFFGEPPLRIGLGTTLRLVPAAASLVLMVRTAQAGLPGTVGLLILAFAALAGLAGSIGWLRAETALSGRPYWLIATASLVLAAAVQGPPAASLAWSLALLLPGSLIFLSSLRARFLAPVLLLGLLGLSGLPFTPLWAGSRMFQAPAGLEWVAGQIMAMLFMLILFIVHAILLAGYLRHSLPGMLVADGGPQLKVERWVWLLYLPGLVILPVFHFILGWMLKPEPTQVSLVMWLQGACALGLAGAIWLSTSRPRSPKFTFLAGRGWLSSGKIYRPLYQPVEWLFRLAARIVRVSSAVLEGEAGILWAFVLLVFGLLFLQQ